MTVRSAAGLGIAFVVIHLIIHSLMTLMNIGQMIRFMRDGQNITWLFSTLGYFIATVILDVGLIIVFSALAGRSKTMEQRILDGEQPDAVGY
jgi:hypothetical protein